MIDENNSGEFQEFENYETFTDKEIFTKIWSKPKKILNYIHKFKYEKYFYVLLFLAGISSAFDRASSRNLGDNSSIVFVILSCIIGGGLFGWLGYYIYAALLSWTGRWIDGKGNTESIYRILTYSMIPSVLSLLLLIPQIVIYGNQIFQTEGYLMDAGILANIIFYFSIILEVILGIFTIVFAVIGISVVQNFSIGKAILNLLMPLLMILIPLLFIFMIIYILK